MISVKKTGNLNITDKIKNIKKVIETELINEVTDVSLNHFLESFPKSSSDNGGGKTDSSSNGWKPRINKEKYPLLNKTGRLIKSIKKKKGLIYSNLDYAGYHNDGAGWLPKREFIGISSKLNKIVIKLINKKLKKLF